MNVSKINSTPAFKGIILVPEEKQNSQIDYKIINTDDIKIVRKYKNGTLIQRFGMEDCFVSEKKVSFQDVAAAYNMAKNQDNVDIDLTTSSKDLRV